LPDKERLGSDVMRAGCLIGLATVGHHSWEFTRSLVHQSQAHPLNMFYTFLWVPKRPVYEAYNCIFDHALEHGFEYVFLLEEDTIAPPGAWARMLNKLKYNPDIFAITAPYPRKSVMDPSPMFFRSHGSGPYLDWKYGEFFEVIAMPFGCTVLRTSGLEQLAEHVGETYVKNWPDLGLGRWVKAFCRQNVPLITPTGNEIELQSQDLYFSELAHKHGLRMFVDAIKFCSHLDIKAGVKYIIPEHLHDPSIFIDESNEKTAINLGCGQQFGPVHGIRPVRVDFREEVNPDLRMDLRDMSGIEDESYDYVYCSHTLEHFHEDESHKIMSEMARICKPGGEIFINVPNLMGTFELLQSGADEPILWWNIYGESGAPWNEHKTGFTPQRMGRWLTDLGLKGRIMIENKVTMCVRAFKPPLPDWFDEWMKLNTQGWTQDRFYYYELEDPPDARKIKLGRIEIPITDDVPDENIEAFFTPSQRTYQERLDASADGHPIQEGNEPAAGGESEIFGGTDDTSE
jgi:SAM-dependent methyltransferase